MTEKWLDGLLSDSWSVWQNRGNIEAATLADIIGLRNRIFRIKSTTKRPMIPASLRQNMEAFDALVQLAEDRGLKVVVYTVPIRWDVEPPLIVADYLKWKQDFVQRCADRGVTMLDLDRLIPGEHFGQVRGEPDFYHFDAEGHRLLGQAIADSVATSLEPD